MGGGEPDRYHSRMRLCLLPVVLFLAVAATAARGGSRGSSAPDPAVEAALGQAVPGDHASWILATGAVGGWFAPCG